MLYRAFFDDTWDERHQKYAVATGLIASHRTWTDFSKKWKAALHEHPRIEYFHVKELRALDGEFLQFRDPIKWPRPAGSKAASAKRDKLKNVIENTKLAAVSVAILIEDFNLVRNSDPRAAEFFRPDPYEVALQCFVLEVARMVQRVSREEARGDDGHCVGFVSDNDERAAIYTAVYVDFKKKNPGVAPVLRGLAHLDDKKWGPLQAADMVANFANHRFNELLKLPEGDRKILESLPEFQSVFYRIANADKWYLCSILQDLAGISLFERLGISRRAYMSEDEMDAEKKKENISFRPIRAI